MSRVCARSRQTHVARHGAVSPRAGTEVFEGVERGPQLGAGIDPAAGLAQVRSAGQLRARPVEARTDLA